jgi:hypothetical protein
MNILNFSVGKGQVVFLVVLFSILKPAQAQAQIVFRDHIYLDEETSGVDCSIHAWAKQERHVIRDTAFRDMVVNIKLKKREINNAVFGEDIIDKTIKDLLKLCIQLNYHRLILNLGDEDGSYFPRTFIFYRYRIRYHYDNDIIKATNTMMIPIKGVD